MMPQGMPPGLGGGGMPPRGPMMPQFTGKPVAKKKKKAKKKGAQPPARRPAPPMPPPGGGMGGMPPFQGGM